MFEMQAKEIFPTLLKDDFLLQDLFRWRARLRLEGFSDEDAFVRCFSSRQEFRSMIKYRVARYGDKALTQSFSRQFDAHKNAFITNFYLSCKDVGPGLYVEHGFSTILYAQSVGQNLHLNQCVTVGSGRGGIPVLGDNVCLYAGSIVCGGVTIGDNVDVAAGAVVVDSVPSGSVVASPKAVVIKQK
ncbi:hypothetical protein [Marinimicrobium sp. ARAG 43.8]|uniref:hypothetical protein n=1 Tax=Marinimicrobium sp. ARAG 43.8 TaxID=3418719 RepID=UPI003CFA0DF6